MHLVERKEWKGGSHELLEQGVIWFTNGFKNEKGVGTEAWRRVSGQSHCGVCFNSYYVKAFMMLKFLLLNPLLVSGTYIRATHCSVGVPSCLEEELLRAWRKKEAKVASEAKPNAGKVSHWIGTPGVLGGWPRQATQVEAVISSGLAYRPL